MSGSGTPPEEPFPETDGSNGVPVPTPPAGEVPHPSMQWALAPAAVWAQILESLKTIQQFQTTTTAGMLQLMSEMRTGKPVSGGPLPGQMGFVTQAMSKLQDKDPNFPAYVLVGEGLEVVARHEKELQRASDGYALLVGNDDVREEVVGLEVAMHLAVKVPLGCMVKWKVSFSEYIRLSSPSTGQSRYFFG